MATDLKGLNNFRNKLKNLGGSSVKLANEIVDELAKKGADIARQEYSNVVGVNVYHETTGTGSSRVIAEKEGLAYIEFGTGRVGEKSGYDKDYLPKSGVPITGKWQYYYPSQYKRTSKTGEEGWYHKFEGEEKARFVKGQSAGMQMYRTSQRLKSEMSSIIKNKLKGDDTNV